MKKNLLLFAAIVFSVLISVAFVSVDQLDPTAKKKKAKKEKVAKPYVIKEQRNITRVQFSNSHAIGNQIAIRIDKSSNMNEAENIRLTESSGTSEITAGFVGFKNVEYPFTGTIDYTVKGRFTKRNVSGTRSTNTSFEGGTVQNCRLSFTINEPGSWEIKLVN